MTLIAEHPPASTGQPDEPVLLVERRDGIATLTLNRPTRFNALSEELLAALQGELDRLGRDDSLRCVVIAAAGKAFCAGHDLKQMRARPDQAYYQALFARCSGVMLSVRALPVPVIAQVQGLATAAGCQLVATCDLAVAAESARFAVSGINVGLFCSTPAVALSRNIPAKAAFDLLMTGRFIDAVEAKAQGLVNQVVADDGLSAAVHVLATEICAKSPAAVRLGKDLFYRQGGMDLPDAYRYAGDAMACNMMDRDAEAGIDAFIGKRKPASM